KSLLHEPRLLLMDEPATGLDPAVRREMWRELSQLRKERGITIVFTTHLMDEAESCDRLAILSKGKLIALDTPDNLKSRIGGEVVTIKPDLSKENQSLQNFARKINLDFSPWQQGASP